MENLPRHNNLWAVILAAGEGSRLASLTRNLYGRPVPKQFATLAGERSLLQTTVDRLIPICPTARMVVIVPAEHRALARQQLAEWPDIEMVVQPRNAGTGPGIMLPLRHVLARDPSARVLIVPSDHFIPDPEPIRDGIRSANAALATTPIVLVGVQPTHAETEYGWIVPGDGSAGSVQPVATFVEKPMAATARMLMRQGALWNTFLMVAKGQALWDVASRRLPRQARAICRCVDAGLSNESARIDAYRDLESANFSADVLADEPGLGVIRVDGSGMDGLGLAGARLPVTGRNS